MRNSQTALLAALGVIVLGIVVFIGVLRATLMNGGELSRDISGLSDPSYLGQVSNESVVVFGLSHFGRD
jgi:hypothetical protein